MEYSNEIKTVLTSVITEALNAHFEKYCTLKNLDWFNVSDSTTDFYAAALKENAA